MALLLLPLPLLVVLELVVDVTRRVLLELDGGKHRLPVLVIRRR